MRREYLDMRKRERVNPKNGSKSNSLSLATYLALWTAALGFLFECGLPSSKADSFGFGYQIYLAEAGHPAAGTYDFQLRLYNQAESGTAVGPLLEFMAQAITNGVFRADLDFGPGALNGEPRWIEAAVRESGTGKPFSVLRPRQRLTFVPYSTFAAKAGSLEGKVGNITVDGRITVPAANPGTIAVFDGIKGLSSGPVLITELGYLAGARESIQGQLDSKVNELNGQATGLTLLGETRLPGLTPGRLLALDGQNRLSASTLSQDDLAWNSGSGIISVRTFGAVPNDDGDDTLALQAAFDAAGLKPTSVLIPPGVYIVTNTLVIGSGTRVFGAGMGATVLKEIVTSPRLGREINGAGIYATLAMVAAENSSIRDVTVDLRTASTSGNGIVLMPDGVNFQGTPCSNCTVERCEVLGFNKHQYLIWNLRGRNIKILHNHANGSVPDDPLSHQEGIESFGGENVLVEGNLVENVGHSGMNFGAGRGLANATLNGLWVIDNVVRTAQVGVFLATANDAASGPQNISNVSLRGNQIQGALQSGIYLWTDEGTGMRDCAIVENLITNCAQGIRLLGYGNEVLATGQAEPGKPLAEITNVWDGIRILLNTIVNVSDPNFGAISLDFADNVEVIGNQVRSAQSTAINMLSGRMCNLSQNRIVDAGGAALFADTCSSLTFKGNSCIRYNLAGATAPGILLKKAAQAIVTGNDFYTAKESYALIVSPDSDKVLAANNNLLYDAKFATPFRNDGSNPNTGAISPPAGISSMNVTNTLLANTRKVQIRQVSGNPVPVAAQRKGLFFTLVLGTPALGDETFEYELLQ
jgi:hypothetical protein